MNLRNVITGVALLTASAVLFVDSSLLATRPPLLAGSIVGMTTLVGAVLLKTSADHPSA